MSEFTLAQLLQFFALAERSGTVTVSALDRQSRLFVESDRIVGWGIDKFDARDSLAACELMPAAATAAIESVRPRIDTPGLSFVVRNLIEPDRWDAYAQRQLEQDVYPLLSVDDGEFNVEIHRGPPAPLRLSIPINSLILDGSRWESEMEAAKLDGFRLNDKWRRLCLDAPNRSVTLSSSEWLVWATLAAPASIADVARRICVPDLTAIGNVRRLLSMGLIERAD
ncbi:MAG TPA: DUF4388 domain-containing protein [Thermomicrobiales bacterium]|nr:DUF4388 domain-containing protein [Thermomicrobiales bacterium]